MRWPALVLLALIVLLQYPLWLGKGGWLRVWDVDQKLQTQRDLNLKSGNDAIEEHARYELGLIKQDEIFVQVPQKKP